MISHFARIAFLAAALLPSSAKAQVHFVSSSAAPGGDGSSWATAFNTLQDGLFAAQSGEQIWVAEGTYTPDVGASQIAGDRTASFELPSGVQVFGGFRGDELTHDSRRGSMEQTILSGDLFGDDAAGGVGIKDNSLHVLLATGVSRTTRLDGFIIQGGYANDSGSDGAGGGLWALLGSHLQVVGCVFRDNRAILDGGAVSNSGNASTTFEDCSFEANIAERNGGAVYATNSCMPVFRNCRFEDNTAGSFGGAVGSENAALPTYFDCYFGRNLAAESGGALWGGNAAILIDSCTFEENEASLLGGAIFQTGSPNIRDCHFAGNTSMRGGALYSLGLFSGPLLERNIFVDNKATISGGALFSTGDSTIHDCTFARNSANESGGAVTTAGHGKMPQFTACVFTGNKSIRGGAVFNSGSGLSRFERCRFRANEATEWGGAMLHDEAEIVLDDCTFGENTAGQKGGAVYLTNLVSGGTVSDCVFHHSRSGSVGGGLYITNSSSPVVTDCLFTRNYARHHGAGVYHTTNESIGGSSSSLFERCVFDMNSSREDGAGFFNTTSANGGEARPTLIDCLFVGNFAFKHGGGFYNVAFKGTSAPALIGVEFRGNNCGLDGGGFHNTAYAIDPNTYCQPMLANCVFTGNRARRNGAGFFNDNHSTQPGNSNAELIGCVFSENRTLLGTGAGVFNSHSASGVSDLVVQNSILWGNEDIGGRDERAQISDSTSNATVEFSCVEGLSSFGFGCVSTNPLFLDALGADGIAGTCDDNLRLATSSSLIDAGNNTFVPQDDSDLDGDQDRLEQLPHDFERTTRFFDSPTVDTGIGGAPLVDLGPFESEDCDGNGIADAEDVFLGAKDCNGNHIPDICEIAAADGGFCATNCSSDSDGNGILDECEALVPDPERFGEREHHRIRPKKDPKKLPACGVSLRKP